MAEISNGTVWPIASFVARQRVAAKFIISAAPKVDDGPARHEGQPTVNGLSR
jgi:hypothetical protein